MSQSVKELDRNDVTTDYMDNVLQLMDRFSNSDMTQLKVEVEGFKVSLQREVKEIIQTISSVQPSVTEVVPVTQTQIVSVNNEGVEVSSTNNLEGHYG